MTDAPTIYDASLDEERAVTQGDVATLMISAECHRLYREITMKMNELPRDSEQLTVDWEAYRDRLRAIRNFIGDLSPDATWQPLQ